MGRGASMVGPRYLVMGRWRAVSGGWVRKGPRAAENGRSMAPESEIGTAEWRLPLDIAGSRKRRRHMLRAKDPPRRKLFSEACAHGRRGRGAELGHSAHPALHYIDNHRLALVRGGGFALGDH